MDANWCYQCRCPKSVCGAKRKTAMNAGFAQAYGKPAQPVPSALFVGGPRDGQRHNYGPAESFIVPMTDPYPLWAPGEVGLSPVFRTGTYKRAELTMSGAVTTERHVVYLWAGENEPPAPAVGDAIEFRKFRYSISAVGSAVVDARKIGDPPGESTKLTVSRTDLSWSHAKWTVKIGAVVEVLARRTSR